MYSKLFIDRKDTYCQFLSLYNLDTEAEYGYLLLYTGIDQ